MCSVRVEAIRIPVGGMRVHRGPAVFATLPGSCVGLVVQDRARQIGAMAHVVLPSGGETDVGPGYYADRAPSGALQASIDIGVQNFEALVNGASDADLEFAGVQYGAESGSSLILDLSTGELHVEPLCDAQGVSTLPRRNAWIAELVEGRVS